MANLGCQIDTVQNYLEEVRLGDYLDWIDLCACLWDIFLIDNSYRRLQSTVGSTVPRQVGKPVMNILL